MVEPLTIGIVSDSVDGGLDSRVCLRTLPVLTIGMVSPSPLLSLLVEHLKVRVYLLPLSNK